MNQISILTLYAAAKFIVLPYIRNMLAMYELVNCLRVSMKSLCVIADTLQH